MTAQVDVRAVLNWQVRQAENRCDTARTMRGADARVKERDDLRETRAAVSDALDTLRMSAEALKSAAKCVGGDLAIVLRDIATFSRAALARAGGA